MQRFFDPYRRQVLALLSACVLAVGLSTAALSAQTHGEPARFSMVALDLEGGGAVPLRIAVDRWTPDTEYNRLLAVLMDKGAAAFGEALHDARPTGYIRTLESLGWNLRLARESPGKDGGRDIFLITDRPIGFAESWNAGRSLDYPFTVIELHVTADGEGQGNLSIAAKLIPDKVNKLLIIENFDLQRIRLTQVKKDSR